MRVIFLQHVRKMCSGRSPLARKSRPSDCCGARPKGLCSLRSLSVGLKAPTIRASPWVFINRNSLALKGRNNLCVSCICFALSGRGVSDLIVPRALPWAVMFRPFQGKYRHPSNALQQGSLRQRCSAKWRCPTRVDDLCRDQSLEGEVTCLQTALPSPGPDGPTSP